MSGYKLLLVVVVSLLTPLLLAAQSPQKIEKILLDGLAKVEKNSQNALGSGNYNSALKADLLKYAKQKAVLRYAFPALSKKMYITTSRDGKFRIYSWDSQAGGTMRDFENIFQFAGSDGKVHSYERARTQEGDYGSFFHQVFQVATPDGVVYLANSTFIASTSLVSQALSAYRIEGGKLNTNVKIIKTQSGLKNSVSFQYDFFTVVDHKERPITLFHYDETKRSFRFPIVIQDKKTPQGRVTNRFITYRFDGKYFVRV